MSPVAILENIGVVQKRLSEVAKKRLNDEQQLAAVRAVLLYSPIEQAFGAEQRTLKRVRTVIERMHGVRFGKTHVWRILGALGFSLQKPETRAIERNEDTARSWRRRRPGGKVNSANTRLSGDITAPSRPSSRAPER